jgi:hypothetical protein
VLALLTMLDIKKYEDEKTVEWSIEDVIEIASWIDLSMSIDVFPYIVMYHAFISWNIQVALGDLSSESAVRLNELWEEDRGELEEFSKDSRFLQLDHYNMNLVDSKKEDIREYPYWNDWYKIVLSNSSVDSFSFCILDDTGNILEDISHISDYDILSSCKNVEEIL